MKRAPFSDKELLEKYLFIKRQVTEIVTPQIPDGMLDIKMLVDVSYKYNILLNNKMLSCRDGPNTIKCLQNSIVFSIMCYAETYREECPIYLGVKTQSELTNYEQDELPDREVRQREIEDLMSKCTQQENKTPKQFNPQESIQNNKENNEQQRRLQQLGDILGVDGLYTTY